MLGGLLVGNGPWRGRLPNSSQLQRAIGRCSHLWKVPAPGHAKASHQHKPCLLCRQSYRVSVPSDSPLNVVLVWVGWLQSKISLDIVGQVTPAFFICPELIGVTCAALGKAIPAFGS